MIGLGKLSFLRLCVACSHGNGDFGGFSAALPLRDDRVLSFIGATRRGIGSVHE